jgi:membrane-associated phospholipid phosphatase
MPVYLSLWFYVSLPPAFLATRRELFYYAFTVGLMCAMGLIIFYFWPTAVPVMQDNRLMHASVNFLKSIDAAGNACPSLHVATALFSAIWFNLILRRFNAPNWVLFANWLWCIGIIYSTLAVQQHVLVDVLGGIVLGATGAYISLTGCNNILENLQIKSIK